MEITCFCLEKINERARFSLARSTKSLFKTVDKPSSVVYGHLSTNIVTNIPQRYLLNPFGETPL